MATGLFGQPINPMAMGLLGAGAGLLGSAGPSLQPTGWGPALAQGLLGLQGGYGDALKQSLLMEEFRQAQEKAAREQAAAQAETQARAAYQAALGGGDPRLAATALGGIPGQEGAAYRGLFPKLADVTVPKTREVKRGDQLVTEEFDPKTMRWNVVGEAPRSMAVPGGDLSLSDVIAPIYQKLAQGLPLTDGEQQALDTYTNASDMAQILRAIRPEAFLESVGQPSNIAPNPVIPGPNEAVLPMPGLQSPEDKRVEQINALPPGAVLVGTKGGKPVYEFTENGKKKRVVIE